MMDRKPGILDGEGGQTTSSASRRQLLALGSLTSLSLAGSASGQVPSSASPTPASISATSLGEISVTTFGARGDGVNDDHRAISAAAVAASRGGCDLIFPAGVYRFDRTLELGFGGLRVFGRGKVILRFGGQGYAVSIDAGEHEIHYNHHLENLLVIGDGASDQHGFLFRNFVHAVRRNLRVTNIGGTAFDIAGDVLSTYDHCRVADNETDRPDHFPAVDFKIRGTRSISATTACLFINCMAERARKSGWQLEATDNCRWIGGTAEGIDGVGVQIGTLSIGNVFESFFMEKNAAGDIQCAGSDTRFHDCTASSHATKPPYESVASITVEPGAHGFMFCGGTAYAISIAQGAEGARIAHSQIEYRIADAGRGTTIVGCRQGYESATLFPSQTVGNIDNPDPLAFDWYREAKFTPRLLGGDGIAIPLDAGHGASTRLGNVVFISLAIRVAAMRARSVGHLIIDGLPYAASDIPTALTMIVDGLAAPGVKAMTEAGTTRLRIVSDTGGQTHQLDARQLAAGTSLVVSGHYMV